MLFGGIVTASLLTAMIACIHSGIGLHWLWVAPLSFGGSFLGWTIFAALVLLVAGLCVDMEKTREHDSRG